MNIFFLDKDTKKCAEYHYDAHVRKMIVEYAQIICTVYWKHGFEAPYRPTHTSQAGVLWASACKENFEWLVSLFNNLCTEWNYRFDNKPHKTIETMNKFFQDDNNILCIVMRHYPSRTPFIHIPKDIQMSGIGKDDCVIEDYRDYYINQKNHLKEYTKRDEPDWIKLSMIKE